MSTEKLYLVIGMEDGIQSSIWPESQLLTGVLSAIWDNPDNASDREREYWKRQLANDDNWSLYRGYFREGIGEVAHLEIYLITDPSYFTSKLDQLEAALNVTASTAEHLASPAHHDSAL